VSDALGLTRTKRNPSRRSGIRASLRLPLRNSYGFSPYSPFNAHTFAVQPARYSSYSIIAPTADFCNPFIPILSGRKRIKCAQNLLKGILYGIFNHINA